MTCISNAYQPILSISWFSSCYPSVRRPSCKRQFYTRISFTTFVMTVFTSSAYLFFGREVSSLFLLPFLFSLIMTCCPFFCSCILEKLDNVQTQRWKVASSLLLGRQTTLSSYIPAKWNSLSSRTKIDCSKVTDEQKEVCSTRWQKKIQTYTDNETRSKQNWLSSNTDKLGTGMHPSPISILLLIFTYNCICTGRWIMGNFPEGYFVQHSEVLLEENRRCNWTSQDIALFVIRGDITSENVIELDLNSRPGAMNKKIV